MFQELISNITNVGVFTESFGEWISGISINSAIVFIMMIFMLVGAIDKIAGNKRGYGEKFDEGFNAMGPLAAAMAGVVAAAPVPFQCHQSLLRVLVYLEIIFYHAS